MKLRGAHFTTAFLATALFGAGACSSSSPSSAEPGADAGVSGDAAGPQGDGSGPVTTGNDSGGGPGATPTSCDGGPLGPPATHRAADVACPSTSLNAAVFPDGGPPCTTDSECADAGGGTQLTCLQGKCSADQCLLDSDCPAGSACGCANSYYGGNASHPNSCFTSECRVDSDCGSGGYCSPSFVGYCGGLTGYFCHKAADTCVNDTDCLCASSQGGRCYYEPTVSHWQCEAVAVCTG
jgi:hypothetical protein